MTPEEEIFATALALAAAARREYLDRACGDDRVLRENVEALLEAHASSSEFLAHSPADTVLAAVEPQPGERIGPYILVRKLGEGGCGLVFLAEQGEPLRRQVALKLIKPGMDSRQVIARFEAERQALAQMEHADIARVYDAGATAQGRPYFAMEYVEGVPITRFCDETQLSLPARLELFERLCLALQHAHQKGIVHRDLKPSNLLVALRDGRPAPKIIDFGIAKATQARLTDATLLTGFEQFLGTPAYMSPEQAERRDLDIDTRSDIYSLGVLLYELLSGQPPFDPKSLVRAGVDEIRRIIREVDPPRPSAALSTLGADERTTVAHRRAAAPERLTSVLRGDLDWIVMRCMEKDRARRYGTAHELADDIRRHLRSEPILARPPSARYRAGKFARRHRMACAAVAAVALALVAGAIVSTWQAVRATRAEHIARQAQADAQRRQEQAENLLTFMLGDFRTELAKIGRLKLLDAVGDKAGAYFAALDPRDQTDTTLLRHAKALTQIGEIRLDEGRFAEAERNLLSAHARALVLTARRHGDGEALFTRAQVEFWLGVTQRKQGDLPGASRWLSAYRDSALALVALDSDKLEWQEELGYGHHNLAVLDMDRGDYEAAGRGFRAELAILARTSAAKPDGGSATLRYNIANLHSWLGSAAEWSGDYAEARARYTEQTRRIEALVVAEPGTARWRTRLVDALSFEANLALHTGRTEQAWATSRHALELADSLAASDPANRAWQAQSLRSRLTHAELLQLRGDPDGAVRAVEKARREIEILTQAEPASMDYATLMAKAWRIEAECRLAGPLPEAIAASANAVALSERLAGADRTNGCHGCRLREYLFSCAAAAAIYERAADAEKATACYERILKHLEPQLLAGRDWRLLDPAVRALAGLKRNEEARALIVRLTDLGYRPRLAWPVAGRFSFLPEPNLNQPIQP